MSGVRPGTAAPRSGSASRGGAGTRGATGARSGAARGANRAGGEERALTSVAAGDRFRGEEPEHVPRLWHVTLSVSGARAPLTEVRRALEQLAHDHPFLLTSRYADDHAEIRYWEEARDLHDAAAVALRLWGEHRQTAGLPPWEIVGLEVIDRATYHQRIAAGYGPAPATPVGVHPF
ncbi:hypothetical protein [Streptomyces sp. OM5714]|uniref:hypothetical protein n=1 Tax=Streptomyces sp. OM5714 TaxID=2602736 RepID=UPI0013DAB57E|nr:hypothetical protein [Streptomyces sp. OM5714]KAF2780148.1 hypothetical protein STPH1_4818 [Streptomyces sp. OM5714]